MTNRKSAIEQFNKALLLAQSDKPDAAVAYQLFSSSVVNDPTFGQGWFQVGNADRDLKLNHGAVAAFRRAVELPIGATPGDMTPEVYARAMCNLGHCLYHIGEVDEALVWTERALKADPLLAFAHCNASLCWSLLGAMEDSVAHAKRGYELDPSPTTEMTLAFAQLFNRDLYHGLRSFEARFPYKLPMFLNYPYPKWEGEPDKTLFLVSEQGMGDTLSYLRFVHLAAAKCRFVYAAVDPALLRLCKATFAKLNNVEWLPLPCAFPPADCWSTFVSLPVPLDLSNDDILSAPSPRYPAFNMAPSWRSTDRTLHIGIAWAGSTLNDIDRWRSIPFTQFLDLYKVPGIQLYGLQIGEKSADIHLAGAGALVRDLSPHIRDVADTMGALKHLDLVICCESALGHIAGAIGKECWIPYGFNGGDYRIGRDERGPIWYPNHRIFKQDKDARWSTVFDRIVTALREYVEGRVG